MDGTVRFRPSIRCLLSTGDLFKNIYDFRRPVVAFRKIKGCVGRPVLEAVRIGSGIQQKPDNIGVGAFAGGKVYRLPAFSFSPSVNIGSRFQKGSENIDIVAVVTQGDVNGLPALSRLFIDVCASFQKGLDNFRIVVAASGYMDGLPVFAALRKIDISASFQKDMDGFGIIATIRRIGQG